MKSYGYLRKLLSKKVNYSEEVISKVFTLDQKIEGVFAAHLCEGLVPKVGSEVNITYLLLKDYKLPYTEPERSLLDKIKVWWYAKFKVSESLQKGTDNVVNRVLRGVNRNLIKPTGCCEGMFHPANEDGNELFSLVIYRATEYDYYLQATFSYSE